MCVKGHDLLRRKAGTCLIDVSAKKKISNRVEFTAVELSRGGMHNEDVS